MVLNSCRSGIVPLDLGRDTGGPLGRTVRDVAKLLTYITGPDPKDPLSNLSTLPGNVPVGGYEQFLNASSLKVITSRPFGVTLASFAVFVPTLPVHIWLSEVHACTPCM